jgi:ABC-type cobalamin/Fe3+-siderophores transport system ATPase subunit
MTERKLEKRIYKLPNADKKNHEVWYPNRDLLNIPGPYRIGLLGRPNSGKSTMIKNILLRADPQFDNIILIHPDGEDNKEYSDVRAKCLSEFPSPDEWKSDGKTLCIIDDVELKLLDKKQKSNLDRLFGYVSTHKNVSCIITSQCAFNIPVSIRRNLNVFILWNSPDKLAIDTLMRRCGLTGEHAKRFFKQFNNRYDNLMIDMTNKSPAEYRANGYTVLNTDFFET